jgi:hypothetical protein
MSRIAMALMILIAPYVSACKMQSSKSMTREGEALSGAPVRTALKFGSQGVVEYACTNTSWSYHLRFYQGSDSQGGSLEFIDDKGSFAGTWSHQGLTLTASASLEAPYVWSVSYFVQPEATSLREASASGTNQCTVTATSLPSGPTQVASAPSVVASSPSSLATAPVRRALRFDGRGIAEYDCTNTSVPYRLRFHRGVDTTSGSLEYIDRFGTFSGSWSHRGLQLEAEARLEAPTVWGLAFVVQADAASLVDASINPTTSCFRR